MKITHAPFLLISAFFLFSLLTVADSANPIDPLASAEEVLRITSKVLEEAAEKLRIAEKYGDLDVQIRAYEAWKKALGRFRDAQLNYQSARQALENIEARTGKVKPPPPPKAVTPPSPKLSTPEKPLSRWSKIKTGTISTLKSVPKLLARGWIYSLPFFGGDEDLRKQIRGKAKYYVEVPVDTDEKGRITGWRYDKEELKRFLEERGLPYNDNYNPKDKNKPYIIIGNRKLNDNQFKVVPVEERDGF